MGNTVIHILYGVSIDFLSCRILL